MFQTILVPGVAWPTTATTPVATGKQRRSRSLNDEQVREIRWLQNDGMKRSVLARKYSVHPSTIDCVIARRDAYRVKAVTQ